MRCRAYSSFKPALIIGKLIEPFVRKKLARLTVGRITVKRYSGLAYLGGLMTKANDQAAPDTRSDTIRSISRALRVLQAINAHEALTMTQISQIVKIPYPSAHRIVNTLIKEGVIERETSRRFYRPTALVQSLSCGYKQQSRLSMIARPHLVKLTQETGWPAAIATRVGSVMVVQDCTHALTALTFSDYTPGYSLPMTCCVAGVAYLAFSDPNTRNMIIEQIKRGPLDETGENLTNKLQDIHFKMIVEDGYASFIRNPYTNDPGKTSSIGVPLYRGEDLIGAMTLSFFSSAMRVSDAFEKYKDIILETQALINKDLIEMKLFNPENLKIASL